jgi:NAD(P)-dependent dehydrogenase (short-subunit alcohol dehydrogenase family)
MTGLLDKVVVVTGAARGTGRVHCERFAEEGADVIALDAPAAADDLRSTATEVIANTVVFLASEQARYITGTQLVVDAGLTQKTYRKAAWQDRG